MLIEGRKRRCAQCGQVVLLVMPMEESECCCVASWSLVLIWCRSFEAKLTEGALARRSLRRHVIWLQNLFTPWPSSAGVDEGCGKQGKVLQPLDALGKTSDPYCNCLAEACDAAGLEVCQLQLRLHLSLQIQMIFLSRGHRAGVIRIRRFVRAAPSRLSTVFFNRTAELMLS